MSLKAYNKGTAFPRLDKGRLRLYSMRFCPYAHRARLVLAHKNIPFEVINIDLTNKPEWFLERNPFGTVPILEHDNKIVYDSLICTEYLDDIYPDNKLTPKDPYRQAQDKILLEMHNKFLSVYFKMANQEPETDQEEYFRNVDQFEKVLKERGGKFFGGSKLPPLEKGKLRLYSMRFCPFAQRTRLVLAHKKIPFETINVDLKNKPDWFLEKNPLGLVPALEKNDEIVYESVICNEYLDDVYPDEKLVPEDPYRRARDKIQRCMGTYI